ncbi:MAG: zinc-ribbon domain-containing protein [Desulfovibrio sp.]|nr:zinc-ribbon domain-containing protein [Desulfovibrio sp.]
MKITCPDCGFSKDVASEDLPAKTVMVTCPVCACRFRFSPQQGVLAVVQPGHEVADDPLPKGAIIVKNTEAEAEPEPEARETPKKTLETSSAVEQDFAPNFAKRPQNAGNPWDRAPGRIGWLASFYQTCMRIMFAAPRFFRALSAKKSCTAALIFYLIICSLELLASYIWMNIFRAAMADAADPQLIALLKLLAPESNVLFFLLQQLAFATIKVYLTSGLFYLIFSLLAPQKNNFSLIFQITAYSVAPQVLAVVPIAGNVAGSLWSLACLAIGLRRALSLSWPQILAGFLPFILLFSATLHYIGLF